MSEPMIPDAGTAKPSRRTSAPTLLRRFGAALAVSALVPSFGGCSGGVPPLPEVGFKIASVNPSIVALGYDAAWRGDDYALFNDGSGNFNVGPCSGTTAFTSDRGEVQLDWSCAVDLSAGQRKFLESLSGTLTHVGGGDYEGPVQVVVHATNPDRAMTYEIILRITPYMVM